MATARSWSGLVSALANLQHNCVYSQSLTNICPILVIVLIAAEILVAAINIVVDMYWVD